MCLVQKKCYDFVPIFHYEIVSNLPYKNRSEFETISPLKSEKFADISKRFRYKLKTFGLLGSLKVNARHNRRFTHDVWQ